MFNDLNRMYIPDKQKLIKIMILVSISIFVLSGFVFGVDTAITMIYQRFI